MKTVEEVDGVDRLLTAFDTHGNLEYFAFHEGRVDGLPVFRTELDTYQGIFCTEAFMKVVKEAGLTGIVFHTDLANPVGESYGYNQ